MECREWLCLWATRDQLANVVELQGSASAYASFCFRFRAKTGLPLAPLVSAGKWAWLLENNEAIKTLAGENKLRFGTVDAWLIHQLTSGEVHATDLSNASRTGLLNLHMLNGTRIC